MLSSSFIHKLDDLFYGKEAGASLSKKKLWRGEESKLSGMSLKKWTWKMEAKHAKKIENINTRWNKLLKNKPNFDILLCLREDIGNEPNFVMESSK